MTPPAERRVETATRASGLPFAWYNIVKVDPSQPKY